jgi:hypothetical protein
MSNGLRVKCRKTVKEHNVEQKKNTNNQTTQQNKAIKSNQTKAIKKKSITKTKQLYRNSTGVDEKGIILCGNE